MPVGYVEDEGLHVTLDDSPIITDVWPNNPFHRPRARVRVHNQNTPSAMSTAIPSRDLYVCGQWVKPVAGGTLPVICPANESIIGSIPAATSEDVKACITKVVAVAKSGSWTRTTGTYRATFLRAIAQKVGIISHG